MESATDARNGYVQQNQCRRVPLARPTNNWLLKPRLPLKLRQTRAYRHGLQIAKRRYEARRTGTIGTIAGFMNNSA